MSVHQERHLKIEICIQRCERGLKILIVFELKFIFAIYLEFCMYDHTFSRYRTNKNEIVTFTFYPGTHSKRN